MDAVTIIICISFVKPVFNPIIVNIAMIEVKIYITWAHDILNSVNDSIGIKITINLSKASNILSPQSYIILYSSVPSAISYIEYIWY